MLTNQANTILRTIAANFKKSNGKVKPDDWGYNYAAAAKIAAQIAVHCKANNFPEELMKAKAPNETALELQYRKDIFEPITKSYWDRGLAEISKIWDEQNYSIDYAAQKVKDYYLKQFPIYGSLIKYFKSIVTPYKINDPNALLLIEPGTLPLTTDIDQQLIVDQSVQLQPICTIYPSAQVLMHQQSNHALLLTDEKSLVLVADKPKPEGLVLLYVDNTAYYKITQTGKKTDWTFTMLETYSHNLGYLPALRLEGKQITESVGNDRIFDSYFAPAIPYLNKALKQDSTLDVSINKHAYPIRAYYETPCSNPACENGKVKIAYDPMNTDSLQDAPPRYETCKSCNGAGSMTFSPTRDYKHRPPALAGEAQPPFPGIDYITPDPTILEFARSKIKEDIESGFMFLGINVALKNGVDFSDKKTATETKINREALNNMLGVIAQEVFQTLQFVMDSIEALRGQPATVQVNAPQSFDTRDSDELTNEIVSAQTEYMPDLIVGALYQQYVGQRFPSNKQYQQYITVLQYADPLFARSDTNIIAATNAGLISKTDAVLHVHISSFIQQKITENASYLNGDLKTIREELREMARELLKEI